MDSAVMSLHTVSAVGVELPTLSRGSGGHLDHLTNRASPSIYKHTLVPSAITFFGKGKNKWNLQEDNDPKHRSIKAQKWKAQNQIKNLPWPSQSPDLNHIENVWSVLKINVNKYKPNSVKELINVIKKEWKKLDSSFAKN